MTAYPSPPPAGNRPHRSYTRLIVLVGAGLLAACLCLGGTTVLAFRTASRPPTLKEAPTAESSGPIYRKLPEPCALPAEAVRRLVPGAEQTNSVSEDADPAADEGPHRHCQWDMSIAEGKRRNQSRTLRVTVTAFPDAATTGAERARSALDGALDVPRRYADKVDGEFTRGPLRHLQSVGQEAYAQDTVTRARDPYGGNDLWAVVDNLLIAVTYDGADTVAGASRPMPVEQARRGAETAARELIKLLNSCPDCRA